LVGGDVVDGVGGEFARIYNDVARESSVEIGSLRSEAGAAQSSRKEPGTAKLLIRSTNATCSSHLVDARIDYNFRLVRLFPLPAMSEQLHGHSPINAWQLPKRSARRVLQHQEPVRPTIVMPLIPRKSTFQRFLFSQFG
jgi:hypothetical protein